MSYFNCVKNPNVLQNIQNVIKINIKTATFEDGLYSQVVMIRRKALVKYLPLAFCFHYKGCTFVCL